MPRLAGKMRGGNSGGCAKLGNCKIYDFEKLSENKYYKAKRTKAVKDANELLAELGDIDNQLMGLEGQKSALANSLACLNIKVKRLDKKMAGSEDAGS